MVVAAVGIGCGGQAGVAQQISNTRSKRRIARVRAR